LKLFSGPRVICGEDSASGTLLDGCDVSRDIKHPTDNCSVLFWLLFLTLGQTQLLIKVEKLNNIIGGNMKNKFVQYNRSFFNNVSTKTSNKPARWTNISHQSNTAN